MNNKIKQSLILGALTSSFGVFVSKALGLLYYSPLSALAGESNMAFYSIVYTYYETLLNISSAGIPYAIASLVAKYNAKQDYKTVRLVSKIGTSIILGLSFITGLFFILISTSLAKQSLGDGAPQEDIDHLRILFYILTIAVICVPYLSSIRGTIQGLKRMDIYAGSQVLEQFVRVFTIIFGSYIFVKVVHLKSIWAIYVAIAAASLGALIAIVFTRSLSKQDSDHIVQLANHQEDENVSKVDILKELLFIGIPYLFISVLSNAAVLINTTFFMDVMCDKFGNEIYESAKLASGILNANVAKLSTIPSVLALGFGSGMVPYLSESLEKKDMKQIRIHISQILNTVLYILIPVIFIFVFFSKDIYYIMYGSANLELGNAIFKASNLQTFLGTISPILTSIMVALNLRKSTIIVLILSIVCKFMTFFSFVGKFGVYGMIYSGCLYYGIQCIFYCFSLKKKFHFDLLQTLKETTLILLLSLLSLLPGFLIFKMISFSYTSRIICIVYMGLVGVSFLILYYFGSYKAGLLNRIFHIEKIDFKNIISKLKR